MAAGFGAADALSRGWTSSPDEVHRDEWLSTHARAPSWWWLAIATVGAAVLIGWGFPRQPNPAAFQARIALPAVTRSMPPAAVESASSEARLARARVLIAQGDLDTALRHVQDVLDQDPKHLPALQTLLEVHDRADRKVDALTTLERMQTLEPNQERQRQLLARLRVAGQETQAFQALDTLVHRFDSASSSEHLMLADLLMKRDQPQRALDTLDALERTTPRAMRVDVVAAQLDAMLAISRTQTDKASQARTIDQSQARARAWMQQHPTARNNDITALTVPYLRANAPASALALLDPMLDAQSPSVMTAWTRAMTQAGRGDEALRRLATLAASERSVEMLHHRVTLALELDRLDAALVALRSHGSHRAPRAVLVTLAQAALADQRTTASRQAIRNDVLRELWSPGNQIALAAADGMLAARVATAVGDGGAVAKLADGTDVACHGKAECIVQLATMNLQQGRIHEAATAFKMAEQAGDIPETLLRDYARVAVATQHGREALAKLDRQRQAPPSQAFNEAWLLVAAAAGQHREVAEWLQVHPKGSLRDDVLDDLFKLSIHRQAHALTVAAGERLPSARIKPADWVMLAQAQMALNRRTESLATWRHVRALTDDYEDVHTQALWQVVRQDADGAVRAELVTMLGALLTRLPPGSRRDATMQQLIDVGAADQALPMLASMALAQPQRWLAPFEAVAVKAGRNDLLKPVWRKVMVDATFARELRLQRALQLFDAGEHAPADQALRMLATDATPDDAVMQRLFSYWGARLRPDHLDWLEARALTARAASSDDTAALRAAWMKKLNDVGAAARTTAVYRRLQDKPAQGPIFDAYVDALTQMGDRAALSAALRRKTGATH